MGRAMENRPLIAWPRTSLVLGLGTRRMTCQRASGWKHCLQMRAPLER